MKVMVIGHTYCAAINRKKWLTLAELYTNVEIIVVIPHRWRHSLFTLDARKAADDNSKRCRFVALTAVRDGNEGAYRFRWWDLARTMYHEKPSIIQVEQGVGAAVYAQVNLLQKMLCRSAKTLFFTWINWEEKKPLRHYWYRYWLERFNVRCASGAIVGNSPARDILRKKKINIPIAILPQIGVSVPQEMPDAKRSSEPVRIGYVGRMLYKKGLCTLIDAFSLIARRHKAAELLLIGGGADLPAIKKYAHESGYGSRITFRDPIAHTQVFASLAECNIFVLPSYDTAQWKEQFGHVLIEAMVCGVPIVASNAGAIPDVVGDAGILVAQKDSKALADACMRYIYGKDLQERSIIRGYKRVKQLFSHEAIAHKTYRFWHDMILKEHR